MTQIRPTSAQIEQWVEKAIKHSESIGMGLAEQAAAWAMEEAARICDAFSPDERNSLTAEGQCADAIRAAIPKEKEL